jgi:predicted DCC family thiol-disulfide oxidoreductase YuxK
MEVNNIIVFDGLCNFCSRSVLFIIKRDRHSVYRFAPMQSNRGKELLKLYGLDPNNVQTILLVKNGKALLKSSAALEIAREFGGVWKLLRIFKFLPQSILDWFYDIIAHNRYRWFGKKKNCMVPTDNVRERFLA